MLRYWIVLGTVILVGLILACSRNSDRKHLIYVVPNDFKGVLRIVEDPDAEPIVANEGAYIFKFGADGILRVSNFSDFVDEWVTKDAIYEDGRKLPIGDLVSNPEASVQYLYWPTGAYTRVVNGVERLTSHGFIGIPSEYEKWTAPD